VQDTDVVADFASGSESRNSSDSSVTGGFSPILMPEASDINSI